MTTLLWRLVEWHLGRHLSPQQLLPALGDLAEDFDKCVSRRGRLRARLWLVRESLALAGAYRSHTGHVAPSARMTMRALRFEETRLAVRRLVKNPAATLAALLTLACGIGAGAATWSLIDQVLLHPLRVTSPDTLVVVGQAYVPNRPPSYSHLYPMLQTVRNRGVFARVIAGGAVGVSFTELVRIGDMSHPRVLYYVTHDFFEVLGVRMARGRGLTSPDDQRGAPIRAIVSDRFWRRELAADPGVLERTINIAGKPATIAGVLPAGFRGIRLAESVDLFLPLHVVEDVSGTDTNYFAEDVGPRRGSPTTWLTIVGRLRPGMSIEEAAARLGATANISGEGAPFTLMPLNTSAVPEAAREGMWQFSRLLGMTVGALLLIACLTVGMLLLIRTEARRGEIALCLALGATRARLARGVVFEGLALAVSGAVLAVPIAWWLFDRMKDHQLPGNVTIDLLDLSVNTPMLVGAGAAAIAATAVIAIVAGVLGFSTNVADMLRTRMASTATRRRRTRTVLVSAQVAVALVLLSGAGLFARSLIAALSLNPGVETHRLVTGTLDLGPYGYTPARGADFFAELQQRLTANPAIASIALFRYAGGMSPSGRITVDGTPRQFPSMVSYTAVDDRYFSTVGMPVLKGRNFGPGDAVGGARALIVSESFGRLIANGGDPVGHYITANSNAPGKPPAVAEIIGVVPDLITRVSALEPLVKYSPLGQEQLTMSSTRAALMIRAAQEPKTAIGETQAVIRQMDPTLALPLFLTMDEQMARQMGPQRLGIAVLGGLGLIAMLLTIVGAYVLAETMASARQREMGIRAALGATQPQLGGLVLSETARLVGVGLVVGLGLAWLLASTIRSFLFRVEPLNLMTLGVTAAAILVLAMAVSLRPAIGAARVDLSKILREE